MNNRERIANQLAGNPMMWSAPDDRARRWYRKPGYRPGAMFADMFTKFVGQPVTKLLSGDLHKAAGEYVPGRQGPKDDALVRKATDATGAVMAGSSFAKAPSNALRVFAGRNAKTADHSALARAEQMNASGVDRKDIWDETGWFRGVDGKWRWEIDDSASGMNFPSQSFGQNIARVPGDALLNDVFKHSAVYDAYPGGGRISVAPGYQDVGAGYTGPNKFRKNDEGSMAVGNSYRGRDMDGAVLHELQHAIQEYEGFSPGASPDLELRRLEMDVEGTLAAAQQKLSQWRAQGDARLEPKINEVKRLVKALMDRRLTDEAFRNYENAAGEVEARTVQARMNMTPEERRARPPWLDYDVPESNQIVRYGTDQ